MTLTRDDVMSELESMGSEQTRKIYRSHGASGEFFGVKVGDLKLVMKKAKKAGDAHLLALELWDSGNGDARYLAGLMADADRITKKQLESWMKQADWYWLSEHAVAGVAAESPHALACARTWIDAKPEHVAAGGWATWSHWVSIAPDDEIDASEIGELIDRVERTIHDRPGRVRYTMNGFLIAVGTWVPALRARALEAARRVGKVEVDMGATACKVPAADQAIAKAVARNAGKKRKSARC